MITLERTSDLELVKKIVTDARIWQQMSDDFAPAREEYNPPADGAVYVLALEDGEPKGCWILVPRSAIRLEIHTCLLPSLRGRKALEAALLMAEWIWQNTACESLVTEIPETNKAALWFARRSGMAQFGREPKCVRKNGVLWDSVLLALHRPASKPPTHDQT